METTKSLEKIEVQLNPISEYVEQVTKGTQALSLITSVTDKNQCDTATELLNKAKKLTEMIDKEVESICRPIKDWKAQADRIQREIKGYATEMKAPIEQQILFVETMITKFIRDMREQQEREQAKQRAIQTRIEEISRRGLSFNGINYESIYGSIEQRDINNLQFDFAGFIRDLDKKIDAAKKKAEKKGEEFVMTGSEVIPVENAPVPVTMAPKVKGLQTYWKHEIQNETQVPREYCTPDPMKINAAIKQGIREIPGIRIYSEDKIKRTKI